jgi:hypothetical protein
MDEGVRRVGTVIVRTAALFLGIFLFGIHGVTTGQTKPRLVHVFVALADNQHQGVYFPGATPLLWTTGLMAPEAYTLKAALAGWMQQESKEQIRMRAAAAYAQYQRRSDDAAMRLFSSEIGEVHRASRVWCSSRFLFAMNRAGSAN